MELAAYEPRRAVGQGLGYAVANRGGCHLNGGYLVVLEGLGMHVNGQTPRGKADLCMVMQDLMEAISCGGQCLFTSYGVIPAFMVRNPKTRVPLEQMKRTYYRARGWGKNGLPSEKKLRQLGIR